LAPIRVDLAGRLPPRRDRFQKSPIDTAKRPSFPLSRSGGGAKCPSGAKGLPRSDAKTKLALAAFLVAGVAGTAIAAEKAPKRPADVDLTITQTIPAEDAGAPRLCDPRESDAGRCANPAAAPKSPYPVNALQGLNLGF
jgi:hypothetical protein